LVLPTSGSPKYLEVVLHTVSFGLSATYLFLYFLVIGTSISTYVGILEPAWYFGIPTYLDIQIVGKFRARYFRFLVLIYL
jgi:hypothetical protein